MFNNPQADLILPNTLKDKMHLGAPLIFWCIFGKNIQPTISEIDGVLALLH